jgi:hypothetical protein
MGRSFGKASALVSLAVAAVAAASCGVRTPGAGQEGASVVGFAEGWTELPLPPEVRDGAAAVWSDEELILWGGCDPDRPGDCYPTLDGFAFDPPTRTWRPIPPAPAGGIDPEVVWTGGEALFFYAEGWKLKGVAFDPEAGSWRTLPNAPLQPRFGAAYVWTGTEAIVFGGGRPQDDLAATGAAYVPGSDAWRPIAEGPVGLNQATGMWSGSDLVVFGSLLDSRNWARTRTSVGAAYDPETDTWREIPPSELSPQATSAVWTDGRMVAWDYEVHSQTYDPATDSWSEPQQMPLRFSECYPDSAVVGDRVFAFFCGEAALYDPATDRWQAVHGGLLRDEVGGQPGQGSDKLWRFAQMVPAGDVLFLLAEGVTIDHQGTACYGCEGSPHSFWAYRPERG